MDRVNIYRVTSGWVGGPCKYIQGDVRRGGGGGVNIQVTSHSRPFPKFEKTPF